MKIMVIDGNSVVNRAFYGIRPLTNAEGLHTNAIYGFLSIYLRLLEDVKPDGVCVAFDLRAPTFRHKKYDGYKANRKGMPDELAEQMQPLKDVLCAMNIKCMECEGYEADDIIGTVSRICAGQKDECLIVTGDRDSFQLIENDGTNVLLISTKMGRTETTRYNGAELLMKYGLPPELMRDLKALMGDSSDNIPGVAGVGEKTALELVSKFGDIDNLYENIDSPDIRDSVRKKLVAGKDMAYLSKWLGTICQTAPISFDKEEVKLKDCDNDKLYKLFARLEFKSFITRLGLTPPAQSEPRNEERAPFSYNAIKNSADLESAKEFLSGKACAVITAEELSGVGAAAEGRAFAISRNEAGDELFSEFLRFVFSPDVKKTVHGKKTLVHELCAEGISCENVVFDTELGAYVLDSTRKNYDLITVAHTFGEDVDAYFESLSDLSAFSPLTGSEKGTSALMHCAESIVYIEREMRKKLKETENESLYFDIELPFTDTLEKMERAGVAVDGKELSEFGKMLDAHLKTLEKEIYDAAGEEFNILSPKQLGEVLFEHLKIPPVKKTKSGYSTDAEVLMKIKSQHSAVPLILDYRKYAKLKSTYADGLIRFISAKDGKIHTTFRQTVTATGRISSTDPNLQNIPIRTELGGEVRKMFVPEDKDRILIDADYSQIELRVLAHISGDREMCDAFLNNIDIHARTASQVFGVSVNDVTSEMRRVSKAVNFGIVYGISEFSLAEDIGVSRGEAKRYIESYLETFSGVRSYMKEIVERAKRDGFVTTMFGRRRYIPELSSKNFNLRSFGERVALNAPIQGTAADIIKIAMNNVTKRLDAENVNAKLILQVHDELILEAHKKDAEKAAAILTEEMQNAAKLKVPLVAEAGMGETWYAAKK